MSESVDPTTCKRGDVTDARRGRRKGHQGDGRSENNEQQSFKDAVSTIEEQALPRDLGPTILKPALETPCRADTKGGPECRFNFEFWGNAVSVSPGFHFHASVVWADVWDVARTSIRTQSGTVFTGIDVPPLRSGTTTIMNRRPTVCCG